MVARTSSRKMGALICRDEVRIPSTIYNSVSWLAMKPVFTWFGSSDRSFSEANWWHQVSHSLLVSMPPASNIQVCNL